MGLFRQRRNHFRLKAGIEGRMRTCALVVGVFAFVLPFAAEGRSASIASCNLQASDVREAGASCAVSWFDAHLRINEIQTVGTAESYKLRPSPEMLSLIGLGSAADVKALNFALPAITWQLDEGARSVQFDVSYDPQGGLFKNPAGASMASQLISNDYLAAMSAPGFKVIHVLDVDFNSSCLTLFARGRKVVTWASHSRPYHYSSPNQRRTDAHARGYQAAAF
jgi:hypothetical protein